jgi:hypothetical protein
MTATSQSRRGVIRIPSMESLGFMDAPAKSWSTTPASSSQGTEPGNGHSQVSGLVEVPTGRHGRSAEPTGELVKDMWETTELHAPSLVDWAPQGFGTMHLGRRRFRWPMLLSLVVVLLAGAIAAYWLYREPANSAAAAMGQVRSEAEALAIAIDQVARLVDDLDLDRLPEANQDASVFSQMGERARVMFAASADLPADDSTDRSVAADAAGLAIDASRQLMDATAYRTALEPALTLPLLETDPALTDLTTATDAFTEWRAGFESVLAALPSGVADVTSAALDTIKAGLEQTQAAYLDAIRTGNRTAAVEVLGSLRADLQGVRQAMLTDIGAVADSVSGIIDRARTDLDRLIG